MIRPAAALGIRRRRRRRRDRVREGRELPSGWRGGEGKEGGREDRGRSEQDEGRALRS